MKSRRAILTIVLCLILLVGGIANVLVNGINVPTSWSEARTWASTPRNASALVSILFYIATPVLGYLVIENLKILFSSAKKSAADDNLDRDRAYPLPLINRSSAPELITGFEAEREFELIKKADAARLTTEELRELRLKLLKQKLLDDFRDSRLHDVVDQATAIGLANSALFNSRYILDAQGRAGVEMVNSARFPTTDVAFPERRLNGIRTISVNCGALFPAAIATFDSMRTRLLQWDIDLIIDINDLNSHNQMLKVREARTDLDFIFAAEAAFFIISNVKYYRALVVHGEDQWAFVRRGRPDGATSRLLVFEESTAHLQYKAQEGLPSKFERGWIGAGEQIPMYRTDRLEKGDSILVWSPLAYLFARNGEFKTIAPPFKNWISLFGAAPWMTGSRREAGEAFAQIFVEEWRSNHQNLPRALDRLLAIPGYLERHSISAGLGFEVGFGGWIG